MSDPRSIVTPPTEVSADTHLLQKTSSNPHIAEERNQVVQGAKELGEEEK